MNTDPPQLQEQESVLAAKGKQSHILMLMVLKIVDVLYSGIHLAHQFKQTPKSVRSCSWAMFSCSLVSKKKLAKALKCERSHWLLFHAGSDCLHSLGASALLTVNGGVETLNTALASVINLCRCCRFCCDHEDYPVLLPGICSYRTEHLFTSFTELSLFTLL